MSIILSCILFLTATLVIYVSFQTGDEVESMVIRMTAISIFLFCFIFSSLLIKLLMLLVFFLAWPFIGARLSLSFYRQLKK